MTYTHIVRAHTQEFPHIHLYIYIYIYHGSVESNEYRTADTTGAHDVAIVVLRNDDGSLTMDDVSDFEISSSQKNIFTRFKKVCSLVFDHFRLDIREK